MLKKKILYFVFCPGFLLFTYFLFFFPGISGSRRTIIIKRGSSAIQVAEQLKNKKVIFSSLIFRIFARLSGSEQRIMPGKHVFNKYESPYKVLEELTSKPYTEDIRVLIPEGWRAEQIAERLEKKGVTNFGEFLKIVRAEKLEGYLFPSTYFFKKNTPAKRVIRRMLDEFDKNIRPLFSKGFPDKLSEKEVLIIASIVEREAVADAERPLISAVYLNRIRKRMPLEADPTVQYALGYWKKNLTYRDLKVKSPYNTYVVKGLPPAPICNPGYESVYAVVHPAEIDALYFVSDRKGRHIFNVSFSEHKKAIERVKAALRKRK